MSPKFLKWLALALATLTIASLAACAPETPESDTTTTAPESDGDVTEIVDPNYVCDLPANLNFNNTEVNFLYVDETGRSDELLSESMGGGIVSDAVYQRNLTVEEQLGVKLFFTPKDTDVAAITNISNLVFAGDTSIDIFVVGTFVCMTPTLAGQYVNLNDVDNIDLEKHYWNQDYNEMMTFTEEDMQFVATSPTAISLFRNAYLTLFNRDLMEDYHLPDLYGVVKKGDWTIEYQYSLIKDIYVDKNGTNRKDIGDLYGFVVNNQTDMDVYSASSDIHLVTRDETGDLVYNAEAYSRLISMSEIVSALCNTQGTYLADSYTDGYDAAILQFNEQNTVMATVMFGQMETKFETLSTINYGIAPIPKLNKSQDTYGTYIQDQVSCFGISSAITSYDRQAVLGAVLESMSYHSYNIVRPAYYDSTLSLRFMQDPQSAEILDTMFKSLTFDLTYSTGLADVRDSMRSVICSPRPAIASVASRWKRTIENALKTQQESLDRLQG